MKKVLYNPLQFLQTDETVIVDVEDFEDLFQVVLWRSIGHDVKYNHKLPKVNVAVLRKQIQWVMRSSSLNVGDLVGVIHSEDVALQLLCVSPRVALLHHGVE